MLALFVVHINNSYNMDAVCFKRVETCIIRCCIGGYIDLRPRYDRRKSIGARMLLKWVRSLLKGQTRSGPIWRSPISDVPLRHFFSDMGPWTWVVRGGGVASLVVAGSRCVCWR